MKIILIKTLISLSFLIIGISGCVSTENQKDINDIMNESFGRYVESKNANNEDIAGILREISNIARNEGSYKEFIVVKINYFNEMKNGGHISQTYTISPSGETILVVEEFSFDVTKYFRETISLDYRHFARNYSRVSVEFITLINEFEFERK